MREQCKTSGGGGGEGKEEDIRGSQRRSPWSHRRNLEVFVSSRTGWIVSRLPEPTPA